MKWMTLKINLLSLIMQEVDSVTENYINLLNELRQSNSNTTYNEFNQLRESVKT
jgi:hypothetical protein